LNKDIKNIEEKQRKDLIYGRNPVIELLKTDTEIDTIYMSVPNPKIRELAKEKGIVVKEVKGEKLSQMTSEVEKNATHQGVVAVKACAEYCNLSDILESSVKKGQKPFVVICDGIEDPHNFGAILRTCEAAGVDGVIISKRRSASLNSTVFKTSAGAAAHIPVCRVGNISETIETLKKENIWFYGADMDGENYQKVDFSGGVGLVIGSEGFGISKIVKEKCDFLVSLPMKGKVNSLNASVAAGILIYNVVNNR
jgi:23S rRNA (guanosine2251-2'-O)-methyltransferase